MRKLSKISGLLLIACCILTGCSKEKGETGPQGEQGLQGIPGKDGAVIHQGDGAPANTLGKTGDMYLDVSNSMLYGPKNTNDWGIPLDLRGDKGEKGDPGNTGATGAAGSKILSGIINPTSGTGAIGDYYLNRNTGDLFGPKTAIGWGTAINLKGTANVVSSPILDITWTLAVPNYSYTYDVPTPYLNAIGETS